MYFSYGDFYSAKKIIDQAMHESWSSKNLEG